MERIIFINEECKIKYRSEEIVLLPKEFQLLQFLYHSPSRIFSREELLDQVWPMDAPIDRTVDDHIYRLRKKLVPVDSLISIQTIRGQGYQLKLLRGTQKSPLLKDEEVSSNVKNLFHKYHLYGEGAALKLLEENQAVFGFELDVQSQLYLHFMNGDFKWFLDSQEVSFWEKCYYYLHIYSLMEPDKSKTLEYFTKALAAKNLPEFHRLEIKLLNRLPLFIFTKQLKKAEKMIIDAKQDIQDQELAGFKPLILLIELYLLLLRKEHLHVKKKMENLEQVLADFPFSREKASFLVIKGVHSLTWDQTHEASSYFKKAFEMFRQAKYVPGLLMAQAIILFYLKEFNIKNDLYAGYQKRWEWYAEEYNFNVLKPKIAKLLDDYL